jgi:hypothetical protein
MPDFRDFPGLPIRMRMTVGKENEAGQHDAKENQGGGHGAKQNHAGGHGAGALGHPIEITSTLTGVSLDSIADSEFIVPANFKETQLPDIFNKNAAPSVSPNP